jgi:hypothetical protein
VARMGASVSAYNVLVGKSVRLRLLMGRDHRWEDSITMYIIQGDKCLCAPNDYYTEICK